MHWARCDKQFPQYEEEFILQNVQSSRDDTG